MGCGLRVLGLLIAQSGIILISLIVVSLPPLSLPLHQSVGCCIDSESEAVFFSLQYIHSTIQLTPFPFPLHQTGHGKPRLEYYDGQADIDRGVCKGVIDLADCKTVEIVSGVKQGQSIDVYIPLNPLPTPPPRSNLMITRPNIYSDW